MSVKRQAEPGDPTGGACFSRTRTFRYSLYRIWDKNLPLAMFVGLNPSTADENEDDPTVRRCAGFARSWGYGGLLMTNLFAYRSTDPEGLFAARDPVGPGNDDFLARTASRSSIIVAAWGNYGTYLQRSTRVRTLLPNMHHLRLTQSGQPSHPLYLPGKLKPTLWQHQRSTSCV